MRGFEFSRRNLCDPITKIVVSRDAADFPAGDGEKCTRRELVGLSARLGQSRISTKVFAADREFGGGARGVSGAEDDDILQLFPVAAGHVGVEFGEGILAVADAALVHVVGDVFGNEAEHGFGVAPVEGGEVGFGNFGGGHGAEFTAAGKFCQPA